MATLTPEQRQEVQRATEEPVRPADPETQSECVILKADVYDRIRVLAELTSAAYPLALKVEGTCNGQASDDRNWFEIQVLERRLQTVRPEGARFALHVLFALGDHRGPGGF
jgi:hypothetical protein